MNRAYMNEMETQKQYKTNRRLRATVIFLCAVIGIQSYLLYGKFQSSGREGPEIFQKNLHPLFQGEDDPFEEFQKMQKRMDRFFEQGFPEIKNHPSPMKSFSFGGPFPHSFDIEERKDYFVVTLDLPGLDETKVDVTVEDQTLKIFGTIQRAGKKTDENRLFQSRSSSHFERYMTLPGPVKPETLRIDYKDSKLVIKVDKAI